MAGHVRGVAEPEARRNVRRNQRHRVFAGEGGGVGGRRDRAEIGRRLVLAGGAQHPLDRRGEGQGLLGEIEARQFVIVVVAPRDLGRSDEDVDRRRGRHGAEIGQQAPIGPGGARHRPVGDHAADHDRRAGLGDILAEGLRVRRMARGESADRGLRHALARSRTAARRWRAACGRCAAR